MKKITIKEFFDYKGSWAIHTPTEVEAIKLCRAFYKMEYCWCSNKSYIDHNNWEFYCENACYSNNNGCSDMGYYQKKGYEILTMADIDFEEDYQLSKVSYIFLKDKMINIISENSDKYGNLLIEFMESNNLNNLQESNLNQLVDFIKTKEIIK